MAVLVAEKWVQPVDGNGHPMSIAGNFDTRVSNIVQSPTKGFDLILSPATARRRLFVRHGYMYNGAVAAKVGLGPRLLTTKFECGQIDAVGVYTSDTADFIDVGASDFPVSTLVNDTGCILAASDKWNLAKIVVGTARVVGAGGDTYTYAYWNGAAWSALTTYLVDTPSWAAVATTYLTFFVPSDWATGGQTDAEANIAALAGKYAIKIKATAAPGTTAASITSGLLARLERVRTLAATTGADIVLGDYPIICPRGESLIAYWETANAGSYAEVAGDDNP